MARIRSWVLLLLVAGASAEECAAKAGSADGSDAPAEDCGCSSLKRDAALEPTRNGEESSTGEKAPAAVEGALADQGATAARAGGDASAGAPAELLWIPGGEFVMGHNDASVSPSTFAVDGEGPARRVAVSGVWMGQTEVSNAQWAAFAEATGYKSESERFGWSFVFERELTPEANASATQSVQAAPWWIRVDGASWRVPDGPGSDALAGERASHPVVHVSWADAQANPNRNRNPNPDPSPTLTLTLPLILPLLLPLPLPLNLTLTRPTARGRTRRGGYPPRRSGSTRRAARLRSLHAATATLG